MRLSVHPSRGAQHTLANHMDVVCSVFAWDCISTHSIYMEMNNTAEHPVLPLQMINLLAVISTTLLFIRSYSCIQESLDEMGGLLPVHVLFNTSPFPNLDFSRFSSPPTCCLAQLEACWWVTSAYLHREQGHTEKITGSRMLYRLQWSGAEIRWTRVWAPSMAWFFS